MLLNYGARLEGGSGKLIHEKATAAREGLIAVNLTTSEGGTVAIVLLTLTFNAPFTGGGTSQADLQQSKKTYLLLVFNLSRYR